MPKEQVVVGSPYKTLPVDGVGTLVGTAEELSASASRNDQVKVLGVENINVVASPALAGDDIIDVSALPQNVAHDVPFVTQAPEGQWSDPRFQDACEEASILMAYQWVGGDKELGNKDATAALEEIFKVQVPLFGADVIDTSVKDTGFLMKEFFGYEAALTENVTKEQIMQHLAQQRLVITPTDGKKLKNKFFSGDGPERHMTVVVGYDQKKSEFIVNDPGTRRGKNYRYDMDLFMDAIRDYPTGNKESITEDKKLMLVIT